MSKQSSPYPNVYDTAKADEIWAKLGSIDNLTTLNNKTHKLWCDSLSGNSPFLAQIIDKDPEFALSIFTSGDPQVITDSIINPFLTPRPHGEKKETLMQHLRSAKLKIALLTAAMDIAKKWDLDKITGVLSLFADTALQVSVSHLLWTRMHKDELQWPNGGEEPVSPALAEECGYFILAMGKHGARELNYSSDIDLIILYDDTKITYTGRKSLKDCMIKLTQELVEIIDKRTMHGYVFRTDLKLRPDPGATPIAISVDAAESYYHSQALNWERAAMIKARPVAGDMNAANDYLQRINGWIWRKSIDYEALNDIAAIKNQINRHYNQNERHFAGYDVKLGPGGIREIEFFAQINQLILGGRHPEFRLLKTLDVLDALNIHGRLDNKIRAELENAYIFLRTLEHRLQMIADEQTHNIPTDIESQKRAALFMGYNNISDLEAALLDHTAKVENHYDGLLPTSNTDGDNTSIQNINLHDILTENNFKNIDQISDIIDGWRHGRYRSIQTKRAQTLLEPMLPLLLKAFGRNDDPNQALMRFDSFLSKLPGGVQLFSLLSANPKLFELLARIMSLAPALANKLSKRPTLWDAVLEPDFFAPLPDKEILNNELTIQFKNARDYQEVLDVARRWVSEKRFQIGVHILEGLADTRESGQALTLVADIVIQGLIPEVEREFSRRHGQFEDGGIAMLAMGKYGGRELTHTSDLDVVFLYHCEDMDSVSDGEKPLGPSQYFSRLGQNIITAITALTPEGRLFEVDTRLRPSGSKGPLVVTLDTFTKYYTASAWTWEHMALTRARLIYGPRGIKTPLLETIAFVLSTERDEKDLLLAVHKMRSMLDAEFGTDNQWAIKFQRGGLVDIEFIIQYLLLKHGHKDNKIFTPDLDDAIGRLAWHGALMQGTADTLQSAHWLQQSIQTVLRLCLTSTPKSTDEIPKSLYDTLMRATGTDSFEKMQASLIETQEIVYSIFKNLIEMPAQVLILKNKENGDE